jgi:hypothetical protein
MLGWDVEAEGVQGWGKAEPLSGRAEGLEKGQGRVGCAGAVAAALGHQPEGQKNKGAVVVGFLGPGVKTDVDAGMSEAAGGDEAQMPPVKDEAGVGGQSGGLESLWGSQEKSGAVLREL